jgi:hypothetical protein
MFESPAFQRVLARLANAALHDPSDAEVRMVVQTRAHDACEYCLMPTRTRYEVEHVIPVSRWHQFLDGNLLVLPDESSREAHHLDNFAWSCSYCNGFKGDQVVGRVGARSYPLFHPRRDRWEEHFLLRDHHLFIEGKSEIGKATERALAFNDRRQNGPLAARHKAIIDGVYPPEWARSWGY